MESKRNCPCCSADLQFIQEDPYLEFVCANCDHIYFVSPNSITSSDYEDSEKYQDYYSGKPPFLWYHKHALHAASKLGAKARVLDFGCYDGFFVRKMIDAGVDAFGCDWNNKAIAAGKSKFRLEDRLSSEIDDTFDAVVALEVIEHFEDPNVFLEIASKKLKKGGSLIISCPNKNSVYRPSTDSPPHHFSRFSKRSLLTILEAQGYSVEVHEIEYSFIQMARNFIGDRLRASSTNVDAVSNHAQTRVKSNSSTYNWLRNFANISVPIVGKILKPIDLIMKLFNLPYIAQFVVARKN